MSWLHGAGATSESKVPVDAVDCLAAAGRKSRSQDAQQNRLHARNKAFIVIAMIATFALAALFLAFSGALIARQPLRAKLLPLLRRAR